ncbi:hypothetical protein CVT25_002304 [Psilocybe cyanescens]|uniref:Calcium uniporter protein, mitochondrial n=1 Tax=Psilocybe cyanescens TaxID=93625 RepID=A0A409WKR8_PSICY|nr:hypothetical protein CVT25_002304 [Psilocybe cyanescens]
MSLTFRTGKLSPTSSHLFKLILPVLNAPPTVLLLHPSQPLSHVSHLIRSSVPSTTPSTTISFRGVSSSGNRPFQWSDSTELGDFMRDAARTSEFTICFSKPPTDNPKDSLSSDSTHRPTPILNDDTHRSNKDSMSEIPETGMVISIPTFTDRTRFLRTRLDQIQRQLTEMESLKAQCDHEAHRGARRMALGGFGMLVVYWASVCRLTFWDYGWDVMEPITYLSGLSTVILGYLWFLYQGREVSYTSVLARSISKRREALYKAHGLDIERWFELVEERKSLRAEITRIAQDYEGGQMDAAAEQSKTDKPDSDKSSSGTLVELQDIIDEPLITSEDKSEATKNVASPDSNVSETSKSSLEDKEFNKKLSNTLKDDSERKKNGRAASDH